MVVTWLGNDDERLTAIVTKTEYRRLPEGREMAYAVEISVWDFSAT